MNNNERGGIISKVIFIPIGLAFMLGFFVLGYYVGKYQNKQAGQTDAASPLPEIVAKNVPKPDDFTFFKTLTAKDDKTVSIDLKPNAAEDKETTKKGIPIEPAPAKTGQQPKKDQKDDAATGKDRIIQPKQAEKKLQPAPKKEAALAQRPDPKLHYTLQLASYQDRGMAENDVKSMKQKGYAAFVVASELPGKGTWYRVRVGSFTSRAKAENLQKELHAKAGVSPIITIE